MVHVAASESFQLLCSGPRKLYDDPNRSLHITRSTINPQILISTVGFSLTGRRCKGQCVLVSTSLANIFPTVNKCGNDRPWKLISQGHEFDSRVSLAAWSDEM